MGSCNSTNNCNPCGPDYNAINQLATQSAAYARQANTYAVNAENSWLEFNALYLGAFSVAPTVDNEGNPLQVGALYWNLGSNTMFVWDGTTWVENGNFDEFTNFMLPSATPIPAANLVTGHEYEIAVVGTTNWTAIGAASATVGVRFTKNAVAATGGGTARITRDLVTRFADLVNVKDFGAVGDGVTDDTASVQAALNSGRGVYFPIGNYIINSKITVNAKPLKIVGENPVRSGLWFEGVSAGIEFTTPPSNFDTVLIENIQLWKRGPSTLDAAIKVNPPPAGVVVPIFTMNNVSILGQWRYGVWLDSMSLTQFKNVIVDGNQSHTQACFWLTGDGFENVFNGCAAYSAQKGFLIEGTHEGIYIDNCSIVNVIEGVVKTHAAGAEPWLNLRGTHINANKTCVRLERTLQSVISNCLFYAGIGTTGPKTGWIGVDITNAYNEDIIISNNIFNGLTYPSSKIGVSINVGDRIIVQSNHFLDTFTGINAPIGCINSKFQDNKYTLLTNDLVNVNTSNSHYWSNGEEFNVRNTANGLRIVGRAAGLSPAIDAFGTDANININLATKGTGLVSYGTFQAQGDTATSGFITILDAGGTPRKLAVIP